MTNTLHRFGDAAEFSRRLRGLRDRRQGGTIRSALPKLRRFLEIATEFKPVNLGDARNGGALRPSKQMNPLRALESRYHAGFRGRHRRDGPAHHLRGGLRQPRGGRRFRRAVKKEDLGLSINISTSIDGAEQCCSPRRHSPAQRRLFARVRGQDG